MMERTNQVALTCGPVKRTYIPPTPINPTAWQNPLSRTLGLPKPIDGLVYLSHRRRK
ncbi:hypothetical protein KWH52_16825 [Proteus mirabilis]|uniref:hypothetical protein n=1 Tax=Proteus mirabilis TaxID=584 RepID=UPI0021D0797A|nr:hypothetical protein [Proteus mirabilis]MCU6316387.1 hypothetical protein [Proteus mirabilis]